MASPLAYVASLAFLLICHAVSSATLLSLSTFFEVYIISVFCICILRPVCAFPLKGSPFFLVAQRVALLCFLRGAESVRPRISWAWGSGLFTFLLICAGRFLSFIYVSLLFVCWVILKLALGSCSPSHESCFKRARWESNMCPEESVFDRSRQIPT